ncbi:hypothetical protein BY996DRAFT_8477881 [Phakopsora pachyrhizi]|nr:hypothetical protein BY996DRAFT_8477881 [Phakopsora pachyrhizi]
MIANHKQQQPHPHYSSHQTSSSVNQQQQTTGQQQQQQQQQQPSSSSSSSTILNKNNNNQSNPSSTTAVATSNSASTLTNSTSALQTPTAAQPLLNNNKQPILSQQQPSLINQHNQQQSTLIKLLDCVKHEFDNLNSEAQHLKSQSSKVKSHEWDVYPAYSMESYLAGIQYDLATALESTVHNYHDHYIQNNVFWENNHLLLQQDETLGALSRIDSTSSRVAKSHPSEHQNFKLSSLPTQLEATSGLNGEVKSLNEIHAAVSLYDLVRTDSSGAAESLVLEHKNSEQTSLSAIQPLKNLIKAEATAGFVENSYSTFENDLKFTQQKETSGLDGEGRSSNEIYENLYLLNFNRNPNSSHKNSTRKKTKTRLKKKIS